MRKVTFVLLAYLVHSSFALLNIDDETYAAFPPFRYIDRFSLCVDRVGGVYCSAALDLVADGPHELLETMQNYSNSAPRHIDYTKPFYGYCITERCKDFYTGDSDDELMVAMGKCLNRTLQEEYGLGAHIDYATCYRHGEQKYSVTAEDRLVAGLFLALVALVVIASLYDLFVPNRDPKGYLMCFSIPSNWARLKAPWPQDKMTARLIGINGVRTITSIMVILLHTLTAALLTAENPYVSEEAFESGDFQIMGNGQVVMQTFFFLSGLFLTYSNQISNERNPMTWKSLPRAIFLRWLRLGPLTLVILVYNITWMKFTPQGPFWQELVNDEVLDCRRNFRSMALLYSNYVDGTQCNVHHWSTASDLHMYILGLTILTLSPSDKVRNAAMALAFAVGTALAALETYVKDLNGTFLGGGKVMQSFRIFVVDPTFNHLYKRSHTNLPVFVMGMAFGLLLYKLQKSSLDTTKYKKYNPWYWLLGPLLLSIAYVNSYLFRREGARAAMAVRVMYAVGRHPAWGAAIALLILGLVYEVETVPVYRRVLEWPGWVPLMRLTYCTYNVHLIIIRWLRGSMAQLTHGSTLHTLESVIGVLGLSFLVSVVLWLLVEAPVMNLARKLFPEKKSILEVNSAPKKAQ